MVSDESFFGCNSLSTVTFEPGCQLPRIEGSAFGKRSGHAPVVNPAIAKDREDPIP
jgi:hypothetical protein